MLFESPAHDTTYRFEKICANLATIDLNSLLYKYEVDIATAIRDVFGDELAIDDEFFLSPFPPTPEAFEAQKKDPSLRVKSTANVQSSEIWFQRAAFRKDRIDQYLWNDSKKLYFDYDTVKQRQINYESVTAFWALWAGCARRGAGLETSVSRSTLPVIHSELI